MLALSVFAETGNISAACRTTGIPHTTISQWINADGSDSLLNNLREAVRSHAAHKYALIAVKAADAILERLEHGDEILTKSGDYKRVKVSARDLITISAMAADRHALYTGINPASSKTQAALVGLAAQLMDKLAEHQRARARGSSESIPIEAERVEGDSA
jgi:hypothetical protein